MFGTDVETAARQHADEMAPLESCGIVVGNEYVPCNNVAEDPFEDFLIPLREYQTPLITGRLQAVIHSHPSGPAHPSEVDMAQQQEMQVPWGIIPGSAPMFWFGDQCPVPPLEGRVFRSGVADCYSLFRDWWWLNRGVRLINPPRPDSFWTKGLNLYMDNFQKAGFIRIDPAAAQEGDALLFQIRSKVVNHIGVYVGNNLMLHHLSIRLSTHEPVTRWRSYLVMVLRYAG